MYKISYIVPIYNGRECIIRCLDSICSQAISIDEYEVLVIDDCSNDNTRDLVSDYAISHPQVRLICQSQNMRQGAARNRGLKEARGEYISFVDGDDMVLEGIVPALTLGEQLHIDMVYCSCYHEKSATETILKKINLPEGRILSGSDFCEQYQHEGVFWYPWGFLIRRDWLVALNHPFIEKRQHEDRDWLAYVLSHAGTVCNSLTPMYRYVYNPSSTCRTLRYSTVFDHVASGIRHIDLAKEVAESCPKLSATLYAFGVQEIHHSIRLRNLTKYTWADNKHLYDAQYLRPLMSDLKRVCRTYSMPLEVRIVVYCPLLTMATTFFASPLASMIRKLKHQ